jgi:hypothetical protein
VVASTQKWGFVDRSAEFDLAFVDEAWQMTWADFMPLGRVVGRFALIGDPGQIPPTVTSDVRRWETTPRAPHLAAPEVIRAEQPELARLLELPASRRLPPDTVDLVRPFYDFGFDALAEPGERYVRPARRGRHAVDPAIDLLESGSVAALALPTPRGGPPLELDEDVARTAAEVVVRLLDRGTVAGMDGEEARLCPDDVGLIATHRVMLSAIDLALPARLRGQVRVDTPERWQGLERKVMIAVHPLSGALRPSAFDLDTGRLCVMASRHKAGLVLVSRDHVGETLDEMITSAEQPVGRPDVAGRGHAQHLAFWDALVQGGRVVRAA